MSLPAVATGGSTVAAPAPRYARVVVDLEPVHLDRPFDYAIVDGIAPDDVTIGLGHQVAVTFAGRRRTGWVVDTGDDTTADPARVKPLAALRGALPRFDATDLRLYRWVAARWGGTLASVLRHALPKRVAAVERSIDRWGHPAPLETASGLPDPSPLWDPYPAAALLDAVARHGPVAMGTQPAYWWCPVPGDDIAIMVTDLVARCLAAGRGALVIVPDPASTLPDACLALAGDAGADLRSSKSDRVRYRAFLRGRTGHARVAVGERGAVFAPVRDLGLVVVVDEASPAYKERRSPRHHARDVALGRARMRGATTVVTGPLPSAALWRLLDRGDVTPVTAARTHVRARAPLVDVVDPAQHARVRSRMAVPAAEAVRAAVSAGGTAVVLVARRGEGTVLACTRCGLRTACPVCDSALSPDRDRTRPTAARWRCATCDWRGPASPCAACRSQTFAPLAAGTTRWRDELARAHPRADVVAMEGFDAPGPTARPAVAVMTRGSVVRRPAWLDGNTADVLVLADADALLGRPRYDAAEDLLRLCLSVRWARRIVVATRRPTDPAVQALVRWDPDGFWRGEAARRAELGYPPARVLIHMDVATGATEVASQVTEVLPRDDDLSGPSLDGRLVVKSTDPRGTLSALRPLRQRWSRDDIRVPVDVDPEPSLDRRQ